MLNAWMYTLGGNWSAPGTGSIHVQAGTGFAPADTTTNVNIAPNGSGGFTDSVSGAVLYQDGATTPLTTGDGLYLDYNAATTGTLTATGGTVADFLVGTGNADQLDGGAGDDTLSGAAGGDTLLGGLGTDSLTGGDGADTFTGSVDDLDGDTIADLTTSDTIVVTGTDLSALDGQAAAGTITLDTGKTLTLAGITGASGTFSATFANGDTSIRLVPPPVTLTNGSDAPALTAGDDLIKADAGSVLNATDTIDGGAGTDTLEISVAQTVSFNATTLTNVEIIRISGSGIMDITTDEATVAAGQTLTVDASGMTDTLYWRGRNETDGAFALTGGTDKDTIYGGDGGDDTLSGHDGNDFLFGWDGDDLLYGNAGNDGMSGDDGNDTIWGGDGNDTLIGSNDDDSLMGGDGNDWMWGQNDNDTLSGGAGNDTLSGDNENDSLWGGDGDDTLSGGSDTDALYGEAGDDLLMPDSGSTRTGADTITGGAGKDTISGTVDELAGDTIADFSADDTIVVGQADLSALDGTAASGTITLDTGKTLTLTGISGASGTFAAEYALNKTTITLTPAPSTGGGDGGTTPPPDPTPTPTPTPTPAPGGGGESPAPTPVPTPTTSTEDGATVTRTTTTTSSGRQEVVTEIRPTSSTRQDDPDTPNGNLADVTLADDGDDGPALRASLPPGIGLRSEGASGRLTPRDALSDLITRIEQKTDDGSEPREEMTGIGQSFLDALPQGTDILVRTVVPTVATGTTTNTPPLIITGSTTTGRQEALVIDTRSLPSGSRLQLDNVDFASVVGAATVVGGAGPNMVVGDDSVQRIVLGEDDDVLHGGGGDDTVGSEGGDDQLFGGGGDDIVFGGDGDDSLSGGRGDDVVRGDDGTDTVVYTGTLEDFRFYLDDGEIVVVDTIGEEGRDTLNTIERGSFDGERVELSFTQADAAMVMAVAGIYHGVLDRAADIGGLTYWLDVAAEHGIGGVAEAVTTTPEFAETFGADLSDEQFADAVYQHVLGRVSDADGKAWWLARLAEGMERGDMIAGFATSQEHTDMVMTDDGYWLA